MQAPGSLRSQPFALQALHFLQRDAIAKYKPTVPLMKKVTKKFKTPKLVNSAVQIIFPPILGAQIRVLPVTAPCNSINKNLWLKSTLYNISDPIVSAYKYPIIQALESYNTRSIDNTTRRSFNNLQWVPQYSFY